MLSKLPVGRTITRAAVIGPSACAAARQSGRWLLLWLLEARNAAARSTETSPPTIRPRYAGCAARAIATASAKGTQAAIRLRVITKSTLPAATRMGTASIAMPQLAQTSGHLSSALDFRWKCATGEASPASPSAMTATTSRVGVLGQPEHELPGNLTDATTKRDIRHPVPIVVFLDDSQRGEHGSKSCDLKHGDGGSTPKLGQADQEPYCFGEDGEHGEVVCGEANVTQSGPPHQRAD